MTAAEDTVVLKTHLDTILNQCVTEVVFTPKNVGEKTLCFLSEYGYVDNRCICKINNIDYMLQKYYV